MRRASLAFRVAVPLIVASCGEGGGPVLRSADVTDLPEAPSCVVPDGADEVPETWVVRRGDTLASIARRCYGNESLWREIAAANPGLVGPGGSIREETRLRIPRETK